MTEEKKCFKKKLLFAISITALVLSLASVIMNVIIFNKLTEAGVGAKPVVISKQYDKGQSLEKALKTKKPMIVWFYTDWCGFCQRLAPTFGKVTKNWKVKKNFAVAYINADLPENAGYLQEYQIPGYPSVYLVNPETKERVLVDNGKLFAPDAKKELVKEFLGFIDKINGKEKKDVEKGEKDQKEAEGNK